ncbi:tektin-like protein 1 [Narcine bancroftii]|uniref:tektin-like protein 1 n=1 Tax=Narcine bancroftii TaxID=1343680 RepID=UPI003831F97A
MEWRGVKEPAAAIGAKRWRDQAIRAVGLAEAATEITSQPYQGVPFRSAALYEEQERQLARREGCKRLPGELSEKPEPLPAYRLRQEKVAETRRRLQEARQRVCRVGDESQLSRDVLYKVPEEGDRGSWGFHPEMELLPFLRDLCALHSNQQLGSYLLQARSVIGHLCDTLNRLNTELFRLKESRDRLRLVLGGVRKALLLNQVTGRRRRGRPVAERIPDGADLLVDLEKRRMEAVKPTLEEPLHKIKSMLQELDGARKRLQECYRERMLVLDLVPQMMSQTTKEARKDCLTPRVTKELAEVRDVNVMPSPTPAGPYSYACEAAINKAKTMIVHSKALREKSDKLTEDAVALTKAAQKSVNDGLTQKMAECAVMLQHMEVSSGETRASINRAKRWYNEMELVKGMTLGPESTQHLTTRERLDRPLVKVFQRHPGTQLTEAATLVKGIAMLDDAMAETKRNINMMEQAKKQLDENIQEKKAGYQVDAEIVRFRKVKAPARVLLD